MNSAIIKLSCPYEVYEEEWQDILARIQEAILSGKYRSISAKIESITTEDETVCTCQGCKKSNGS